MTSKLSILKAIKEKCKNDCCAGDKESWTDCQISNCALFIYRFGKDFKPSNRGYKLHKNTSKKVCVEHQKQSKIDVIAEESGIKI